MLVKSNKLLSCFFIAPEMAKERLSYYVNLLMFVHCRHCHGQQVTIQCAIIYAQ